MAAKKIFCQDFLLMSNVLKELFFYPFSYLLSIFPIPLRRKGEGQPILLVHGYLNSTFVFIYLFWKLKGPVYTVPLGCPFASIKTFALRVAKEVEKIYERDKKKPILVGHSMGGLIAIEAAKITPHVEKIITLASPIKGTKMAYLGFGKCCKEMLQETKVQDLGSLTCYASKIDHLVVPFDHALADGVKKIGILPCGHASMLFSREVAKILNELNELNK